jgi:hypothetical protein
VDLTAPLRLLGIRVGTLRHRLAAPADYPEIE